MGWGKKKAEADGEESKRSRLFGGKKEKPASPAPSASNPYAAAPPPNGNPYASKSSNPYAGANGKSDPVVRCHLANPEAKGKAKGKVCNYLPADLVGRAVGG